MPDIDKVSGAAATALGGMSRFQVDPDRWMETFMRALGAYVRSQVNAVYDVRMSFPDALEIPNMPKLQQTILAFEIEDVVNEPLGIGDNFVDAIYDETNVTVTGIEGRPHLITLDVGIWASSQSGGTTARMRAYQELCDCFVGSIAYNRALNGYDFEIRRFNGGIFVKEAVSDIPVFRVVAMELEVVVHSRMFDDPRTFVQEVDQAQGLETLDEEVIVG